QAHDDQQQVRYTIPVGADARLRNLPCRYDRRQTRAFRSDQMRWLLTPLNQSAGVRTRDLSFATASRSKATISATSSSKDIRCGRPGFSLAFDASPMRRSTSVGRK